MKVLGFPSRNKVIEYFKIAPPGFYHLFKKGLFSFSGAVFKFAALTLKTKQTHSSTKDKDKLKLVFFDCLKRCIPHYLNVSRFTHCFESA